MLLKVLVPVGTQGENGMLSPRGGGGEQGYFPSTVKGKKRIEKRSSDGHKRRIEGASAGERRESESRELL